MAEGLLRLVLSYTNCATMDPGLIATLKQDVISWLEASVAQTAEQERRLADDARAHWFIVRFDREGYYPVLIEQMRKSALPFLSSNKFPKDDWRKEEFAAHSVVLVRGEP